MKLAAKILGYVAIAYAAIFGILGHIITVPVLGTMGFVFGIVCLVKAIKGKLTVAMGVLYIIFAWDVIGGAIMITTAILNKKLAVKEAYEIEEDEDDGFEEVAI